MHSRSFDSLPRRLSPAMWTSSSPTTISPPATTRSDSGTPSSSSPPTPPSPLPVSVGPGGKRYPFSPSPTPSPPFSPDHSSPGSSPLLPFRRPRPEEPSVFSLDKPANAADACPPSVWWRRKNWLKWLLRICFCCCCSIFCWE